MNSELRVVVSTEFATTHSVMGVGRNYAISLKRLEAQRNLIVFKDEPDPFWPTSLTGLQQDDRRVLEGIPNISSENDLDCMLTFGVVPKRHVTPDQHLRYFVTEYGGLGLAINDLNQHIASGGYFVVPSRWVLSILQRAGVDIRGVRLLPSGISAEFRPQDNPEHIVILRTHLGIPENAVIFGNVGALTLNKGTDILLEAFDKVVDLIPEAILIIKDASDLYGITLPQIIKPMVNDRRLRASTIDKIRMISGNLSISQLASLYQLFDCYVSPYRAEGFNLPVLESIASGTPVIVSTGGPTDEFAVGETASKIDTVHTTSYEGVGGDWLKPATESLIELMVLEAKRPRKSNLTFQHAAKKVRNEYLYEKLADQLLVELSTIVK